MIELQVNREGNNFSFICCAKQQTILLGVPRAWQVLHEHRLSDLEGDMGICGVDGFFNAVMR